MSRRLERPPQSDDAEDNCSVALPARLERLLQRCVTEDASDIHLGEGFTPYLRSQGPLETIDEEPVLDRKAMAAIADYLSPNFSRLGTGSTDGAFTASDGTRYRFNLFWRSGGLAVALRRLEDRFRSLEELGLPNSLYGLCDLPYGLVLVSGPTGSGKSTTLATLIDRINQSHACHVITIEDPVEYIHRPAKALVNQRQVGLDTDSFNEALINSLREDPDVVLVGEIRDTDTIRTAITAAETGHLVLTSVHAGDCVSTIERMVGVFPAEEQTAIRQQLALVLRSVVSQRLLVADGAAVKSPDPQAQARQRVVASEVLNVTPAVSNLLLNSKGSQIYSCMEAGAIHGMQTFEQDLARLLVAGQLSERSALAAAKRPEVLLARVDQIKRKMDEARRSTARFSR
ncbi:MAG: PilT/PilU family type 4a pilus ATPase [Pseudomonadota bacterium]